MPIEPAYAYEIFPSTAARFAPVADLTFEGRRFHVSKASTAKAAASLASEGKPYSSENRNWIPSGARLSVSVATRVAFLAPPPERIISRKDAFVGWFGRLTTNPATA